MQSSTNRRTKILSLLESSTQPMSGASLAKSLSVSRQIIVQDIALLRAQNHAIISTNKGYLYYKNSFTSNLYTQQIHVAHSLEDTLDEMYTILDLGGSMLDVFVEHDVYGTIHAELIIQNHKDADIFVKKMLSSTSKPLKSLTGETHWHTITAPSQKAMELIIKELSYKGYLQ